MWQTLSIAVARHAQQALGAIAIGLVIATAAWTLGGARFVTHRVGGPDHLWAAEHPPGEEQPLVRLAVAGDVGSGDLAAYRTASSIAYQARTQPFDALLLLGDNVYPDGDPRRVEQTIFGPFASVLDEGTRLLPVLGNHDVDSGFGSAQARALGMPGPWYAIRIDELLIVALDSNRPTDPDQQAWLASTLAHSDARWIVVMLHHPPYSAGWHGSDEAARDAFAPLFERYGVQLVLSGHDHDYQRSEPIEGVTYVVSGAAAKTRPTSRADFTESAWSVLHWLEIEVWADRLELRAVSQDGLVFDRATIEGARTPHAVSARLSAQAR